MSGIQSGLRYTRHSPPMRSLIVHNVSFALCASARAGAAAGHRPRPARARRRRLRRCCRRASASAPSSARCRFRAALHRTSLNTVVTSCVLLWIVGALLIASAGYTAVALARGVRHRRGLDGRLFEPVRRNADLGAGLGARARGRDESHRRAGEHGAGQRALGLARVAGGHAASRSPRRPARCSCCWRVNRRVRVRMGDEADVTPGMHLPDLAIAVEPQPDDGPVLIQIEYRIDPDNVDTFMQRDPRRRDDPAAQRRERLARLPRPGRGGPLRRALHHPVVGRIRPAADADDDGRPRRSRTGSRDCSGRTCRCACRA